MTNVTLNGIKVGPPTLNSLPKTRPKEARSASLEVFGRKNTEIDKFKVWPELSRRFPANPRRVRSPVSGDLRGFRGSFRPNHGEIGVVQGGDRRDALMCGARELLDELQVQESQRCGDYEEFDGVLTDWTKLGLTFGCINL
ncbi:uncharacterized protein LOC126622872 [Malus sylvestris]|uniref:uncharacterized protein LOC126622872 n=1 Tax=Malus sylvestris TaxID=3752 RepID=UPI0021AD0D70|nr:uncharacterized protein LOC126622872 [Malus sylvestris]